MTGNHYEYRWVAYTPQVLVCWEVIHHPDGSTKRTMIRLLVIGTVDATNLRKIPLRLIHADDMDNYPAWSVEFADYPDMAYQVPAPPQWGEVEDAWQPTQHVPEPALPEGAVYAGPRRPGETPDEWYARVAAIYKAFGRTGKPTTELADLMGVPKDRAAQWVHQARKRGYLEATNRGKARQ